MAKLRINKGSSLDEIERAIENVLNCGQKEVELKILIKIAEALGAEYITGKKSGGGSQERFRYTGFLGIPNYQDGLFRVDSIHGSKSDKKVMIQNVKRYFVPHLKRIINMKRTEK